MFVTSTEQRAGLLVVIVTGGRPKLDQRPTARFVPQLRAAGVHDVVWAVSSHEADDYEPCPDTDLAVYPREWALDYARQHWMLPEPPADDAFLGAFPGREWACLEAERRGCWGVLQLDDNIITLAYGTRTARSSYHVSRENGGMSLHVDVLAAMALSTNARMVGAQLSAVNTGNKSLIRPGFPYSLFIERVGDGREHWYGPYEDDITHAFQYGDRHDGVTAAVVPVLRYQKESKSKTGMRAKYDHTRSVQLQRLMPHSASIGVRASRSNGRGGKRVFHAMTNEAIRNPVRVRDPEMYTRISERANRLIEEWFTAEVDFNRDKVRQRLAKHEAR